MTLVALESLICILIMTYKNEVEKNSSTQFPKAPMAGVTGRW